MRPWIEREGFPVVSLERRGRSLHFRQRRFRARGGAAKNAGTPWPIPWVGRVGTGRRGKPLRQLVERSQARVALGGKAGAAPWVYGNAEEAGFFRPLHDDALFAELLDKAAYLEGVERMGWVDHEWALVRSGECALPRFLALVEALEKEDNADVVVTLRGPLAALSDPVATTLGAEVQRGYGQRLVELFGANFERLGWDAVRNESARNRECRAAWIELLGLVAEWDDIADGAEERIEAVMQRQASVDPHWVDAVVEMAARRGDAKRFAAMRRAARDAPTPQERRRFLFALASFRDRALIERVHGLCLGGAVPTQDVAFVFARLLGNPAAREATWAFLQAEWKRVQERMPPMLASRLVEATPALGADHAGAVKAFFHAHPLPTGPRSLEQALERFDLDARFTRRARRPLARWLGMNSR